ncbi:MAG: acyltransferase, partial [Clostridia bacterium]|nr:acyltransferase [Clostridia bacterium]
MKNDLIEKQDTSLSAAKGSNGHYKAIDLLRLICSFFVVMIHMGLGNVAIIPCVTHQAVPFFFMVSGFFYAKRISVADDKRRFAKSYALLIAAVYAVWMLLWLPYNIGTAINVHKGASWIYIAFVVIRRVFLAGMAPYWYLLVLFEGSLILGWIIRSRKYWIGWILCIGGISLDIVYCMGIGGVVGDLIRKAFYTVFSWPSNVIMCGFPMMFIGMIAFHNEETVKNWKLSIIIPLYLLTVIAAFAAFNAKKSLYGFPIGYIEAFLLFAFGIVSSRYCTGISNKVCRIARNLSSVIFLTHTAFLMLATRV